MIKYQNAIASHLLVGLLVLINCVRGTAQVDLDHQQKVRKGSIDVSRLEPANWQLQIGSLASELDSFGMPPADYVVSKFEKYDVVLFGEIHEVKENCEFVASLISPMHQAGVYNLFSEFIPTRFNSRIDQITTATTYDEQAVVEIFRQRPSPTWGYREYMDIVKAVWEFNQTLDKDQPRFKLIGLEDDWNEVHLFHVDAAERFKIVSRRETHMTGIVQGIALEQSQKGLVHIGYAHTVRHGIRMAAELEKSHPGKIFQVATHHEFSGTRETSAFTKLLESAVEECKFTSVGFDIEKSPFAAIRDDKSAAFQRIGSEATFKNLAQGYVFLKPLSELTRVSWVHGFINEARFEDALEIAKRRKWISESPQTAQQLDQLIAKHFKPSSNTNDK